MDDMTTKPTYEDLDAMADDPQVTAWLEQETNEMEQVALKALDDLLAKVQAARSATVGTLLPTSPFMEALAAAIMDLEHQDYRVRLPKFDPDRLEECQAAWTARERTVLEHARKTARRTWTKVMKEMDDLGEKTATRRA